MREKSLVTFRYYHYPVGSSTTIVNFNKSFIINRHGEEPVTEVCEYAPKYVVFMEEAWSLNFTFQGNSTHPLYASGLESEYYECFGREIFEGWWENIFELIEAQQKAMMYYDCYSNFDPSDAYHGQIVTVWSWWDYSYPGSLEEPPDEGSEWELLGVLDVSNAPIIKQEKRKSILDLKAKPNTPWGGDEIGQCSCSYCKYLRGEL